jgi:hypothetical protein
VIEPVMIKLSAPPSNRSNMARDPLLSLANSTRVFMPRIRALKSMVPATEYDAMADQCQRGEREVRLENGFVLTCFSPKE